MNRIKAVYREIPIQYKLFLLGIVPCIPPVMLLGYIYVVGTPSKELLAVLGFSYFIWISFHFWEIRRICHEPFNVLATQVRSIHQGDYTQRLIRYSEKNAIGHLHDEINSLADELQNNRLASIESNRRFQYLIDQLEIGVISFDEQWRTTLINKYLARLFDKTPAQLKGTPCQELGFEGLKEASSGRMLWMTLPKKSSRYVIHANEFRDEGRPQHLFMLTDVNSQLREEERLAWQRLIRVLGHELNNSLTPIISLSNSLRSRFAKDANNDEDTVEALELIANRASGMNRFVKDYSQLAKLPKPNRKPILLHECLTQTAHLLGYSNLEILEAAEINVVADPEQLQQLFINLIKNAFQAVEPTDGNIAISWKRESTDVVVFIDDNGPGIQKTDNLFVPFFSTKPGGSGIGLVLSRQIAEENGGSLELTNREEGGCRATIRLPIAND